MHFFTESFLDEDPALDVFDLPIVLVRWHALLAADDEQRHRGRRKERQSSVQASNVESLVGRTCPHNGLLSDSLTPLNREINTKGENGFHLFIFSSRKSCFLFSEIVLVLTIQFVLFTHLV